MNYEQAMEYIHAVQWAGHKPGLTRTRTLLAALGDPHKKLQFVHVAGTNGKGSTAAMLASCLQAAGYRVGLYTSPFINRFNERIQINGQQIPDEALVALVEQVKPAADAMEDVPTEFEIITALGMLYFAQQQCDIVVLEVGLGGTLDSTNVIEKPACAVITALGMDHVKELGPTLADIAAAKAGIIKPGCPVVSYGGAPEADAVLRRVAAQQHASFTEVDFAKLQVTGGDLDAVTFSFDGLDGVRLPLIGSYQPRNAALAITALTMPDVAAMIGLGRETLRRMDDFSQALLPVMAALTAATGRVSGAAVGQGVTVLFSQLLLDAMDGLLIPLIDGYVAVSCAWAAVDSPGLKKLGELMKGAAALLLTGLLLTFVGYLTASGAIAGSVDAAAVKTAKLAISRAIPVVGGILADASETVLAGAGVLRGTVGAAGMLDRVYKAAAALCAVIAQPRLSGLIDALGGAFGMVLGMTGAGALVLLVSVASALTAVGGG